MEADGHRFKQSGNYAMCCCPFHDDRTPSFSVMPEDTYARCFGCEWHGNIFDYEMKAHMVGFVEALHRLEKKAPRLHQKQLIDSYTHRAIIKPRDLGPLKREQEKYLHRLKTDSWIQQRVCDLRNTSGHTWKAEIIKKLAEEGSLGWSGDSLAFIYNTGTKYRQWPGRGFYWDDAGTGNSIWREDRIEAAREIHLTEGETDAISLVNAGLEKNSGIAVCAVPGASSFSSQWVYKFQGKRVTLWFDADEAGDKGLQRVGNLLNGVASSVNQVDLKEVL